jgi:hypothetical protein
MTHNELQAMLLGLAREHYEDLWHLLEDLETVLWKIKRLNDDREMSVDQE